MSQLKKYIIKFDLFRYKVMAFIISILLLVCAIFIMNTVKDTENDSHKAYIDAIMGEYKIHFDDYIQSNLNILSSVSDAISQGYLTDESGNITLPDFDRFTEVTYISSDSLSENIIKSYPEGLKNLVEKGLSGSYAISPIYEYDKEKYITFQVPVIIEREVSGMVLGTLTSNDLEKILNSSTYYGLNITLSLVDGNGEAIYHSKNTPDDIMNDIISEIDNNYQNMIPSAQDIYRGEIMYNDVSHPIFVARLSTTDWVLVHDDINSPVKSPVSASVKLLTNIFLFLMLIFFVILFFITVQFRDDKRQIIELTNTDILTKLYNLDEFLNRANLLLSSDRNYVVAILNYRHFHYVNTVFGREIADQILIETAHRLKDLLGNTELVCRFKSDEFCILIHSKNEENVRKKITNIFSEISDISKQFNINYNFQLYCGCSPAYQDDSISLDELINQAENALKSLKDGYMNSIAFYDENIHKKLILDNELESRMNQALENGEFKLFLQPKKNLLNDTISGAEALVRWQYPDGKTIFPNQFIPLFEKNGFCLKLDLYMIEQACIYIKRWIDAGKEPIPVSVNQSKLLFYQDNYIESLCAITKKYDIPNNLIILEILENLVAEDITSLNNTISELHSKGFQISMDDFGSGYSSLNIFTRLSIDEIKLDREFLQTVGITADERQKKMLENIISFASDMGIRTVAEGIETDEQNMFLKSIHCDYGQGYLYSKPIDAEEFEKKYIFT